jgi:hemerythrin-like domain-containing protein
VKRSDHLKKLSWEHHDALKFARRIQRGMGNGTPEERIARYVIFIVETLLQPHFELEEVSLIKRLPPAAAADVAVTRVIDDHREFNRLVVAIEGGGGELRPLLESLVDLLKRHVKWEEQRFLPYCEQVLCDADLELIRGELDQGHLPGEVPWDDPFWG